jgi:hypothetical protein
MRRLSPIDQAIQLLQRALRAIRGKIDTWLPGRFATGNRRSSGHCPHFACQAGYSFSSKSRGQSPSQA